MIRGMAASRFVAPSRILVWDSDSVKLKKLARALRVRAARSNSDLAEKSRIILLAVKPQQMEGVLKEIRPCLARRPLLVSIAAGISIRWIEKRAGRGVPVVRVMPNTPALVRSGIAAIAPSRTAVSSMVGTVKRIFQGVGEVVEVPEKWMNAVTAVSGSGPAYFFFLMEQMIEAGVRLGLSRPVARRLVLATAEGAAQLAKSGEEPKDLRARVTSKGGTTEAAFKVYAKAHLGETIQRGIRAAAKRAGELGR